MAAGVGSTSVPCSTCSAPLELLIKVAEGPKSLGSVDVLITPDLEAFDRTIAEHYRSCHLCTCTPAVHCGDEWMCRGCESRGACEVSSRALVAEAAR